MSDEECEFEWRFTSGETYAVLVSEKQFDEILALKHDQQARYSSMRRDGESHNIALMLASRQFPGLRTDAIFNEAKFGGVSSDHCGPHELWLRKQAEQAGVSTSGKWYCSGLASYSGDPTAWIDSRSDVARVAREKGLKVEGYVNYAPPETAPLERVAIDPEIVHRETRERCAAEPGLDYEATYHHVADLRSGKIEINKPAPVIPLPDISEE